MVCFDFFWRGKGLDLQPSQHGEVTDTSQPRSSFQVLVPIVVGVAGIASFVIWEFHFASEPIVDKRIFKTWTAISTYIQTMLHGLILWAAIYFLGKLGAGSSLPVIWSWSIPPKLTWICSLVLPGCEAVLAGQFGCRLASGDGVHVIVKCRCRSFDWYD